MRRLIEGDELPRRSVIARNTAADEAGSIHDDAYAAGAGYHGGLVPGVTLLAYLTPVLIAAFGAAWPQRGRLRARFVRPAYHGEQLIARATVSRHDGDDVALACRVEREDGVVCIEAEAACLLSGPPAVEPAPWRRGLPAPRPSRPAVDGGLPLLTPETLVIGEELSPLTYRVSLADAIAWAAEQGDDSAWYCEASPFGGPVVHPAWFARDPIVLLRHNFARKATVHAATDLSYQHAGYVDRDYTVYGYIADVYERNGQGYVEVETLTVDQDGREIVRNRHTSVIRLRGEATAP